MSTVRHRHWRPPISDLSLDPTQSDDPLEPGALAVAADALVLRSGHSPSRDDQRRALGAVLGGAVGDALGAPFEFGPAGAYSKRFPAPVHGGRGEMVGGGAFQWAPGEFTDDTQMAVILAESLLEHDGLDPSALFRWWVAWSESASDVGITTRIALGSPDWRSAAAEAHEVTGRSAANGALMRVAPVGVAMARHGRAEWVPAATLTLARAQAALTHHDRAAGWGAALFAEALRRTVLGDDPMEALASTIRLLPEQHRETFDDLLGPDWAPGYRDAPSNGSVWGCLAEAVWAVRRGAGDVEATLRLAIDLGGDTDTVACVAGALVGAHRGVQAIPIRWLTYIHGEVATPDGDIDHYSAADLQGLARRLLGLPEPAPAASERHNGPTEVADGLLAASFPAAVDHVRTVDEIAVLSLCRTDGVFADVETRREAYVVDKASGANPDLGFVVAEAVATIEAWLAEGRRVLVHCHGGRSRTGLVLIAWAMRHHGWSYEAARSWLEQRWPHFDPWNDDFQLFLRRDWV
jgi:ADP-ribosyl-[dinitrogen reductase] hydrolase